MIATTYSLFLRRELPSRQTVILTLASLLPAAIALIVRLVDRGKTFLEETGAPLTLQFTAVLVPIFFAVSAFHEEFESRTIVYLLTRPPTRAAYVVGKFLTAWTCSALSVVVGIAAMTVICAWGQPEIAYYLGVSVKLAVTAILMTGLYTAFFLVFGLTFRNPVIASLGFTLGWEYIVGLAPGRLQYWTLGLYPKSIFVNWADAEPQPFFPNASREAASGVSGVVGSAGRALLGTGMELPSLWVGLGATLGLTAAGVLLAIYLFQRRDDA
jgi:hypothetical protein